jgi:hypothetical protein
MELDQRFISTHAGRLPPGLDRDRQHAYIVPIWRWRGMRVL